jgi:hypothetical protein
MRCEQIKWLIVYVLCFGIGSCYAQKLKNIAGTYFSKDTLQPATLFLKLGSDKSISGILISEAGREYAHFTRRANLLDGYFVPSNASRHIQAAIIGDSLDMTITEDGLAKRYSLTKLQVSELDISGATKLDQILFGKWVYFDETKGKLIHNQYFIYYPDGSFDFGTPQNPSITNSEMVKSGRVKLKWTTQYQHLYLIFETNLPLMIPNSPGSTYRVVGDTLYISRKSGKIDKSVRDKSFMP